MVKKKGLLSVFAVMMSLVVVLSACGGKDNVENTGGTGEKTESKQISFMFRGGPEEQKAYEATVKKFESDNPGVKVKIITTTGDQYATKLKAAITGKSVPDVFYFDPGDLRAYANGGVLKDITENVSDDEISKIFGNTALIFTAMMVKQ